MFPLAQPTTLESKSSVTDLVECARKSEKDARSLNCSYNEELVNYIGEESLNSDQSSNYKSTSNNNCFCSPAEEKLEEVSSCCSDNWDVSTSSFNVSYHFLSEEEEGNDRCCRTINNPSPHYNRPLSTTSKLSSSERSLMGGVEPESLSLFSSALNKMPSYYLDESKTARFAKQQSVSFSAEDSSVSSACNKRNTFSRIRYSQSSSSSSTSSPSERSNGTPSSSLQSLPFTSLEETGSCIATTIDAETFDAEQSVKCGKTGNQNKPSTSIWASLASNSKRNASNSSRASSLFSAPLLAENQISPASTTTMKPSRSPTESYPYNYYNISNMPTLSFANSSQRNKKKVKSRARAGNKTDFPLDYSTQSVSGFHNRWIFPSSSDDKHQKQHKSKTSYSYYIGKIKQFHQSILSGKNSDKSSKLSKKHCSSKVNDSSTFNTSQLIPTNIADKVKTENIPYTAMANDESGICHLKSQPTIKITVSPDTPDAEGQNPQHNNTTVELDSVKNSVAHKIYSGNSQDSTIFSVEDFSLMDFPNCVDFGITDFLCCKDEVDVDLSSDTDTSFLEAAPPHRFSDTELEQIEAMSITLDTTLNLNPKMEFLSSADASEGHKAISAPPEMESETTKEFLEKDLIFTLKQLQANNNLMKKSGNENANAGRVLPKPFRRHISLPATVFMRYIFDHDNKGSESSNESQRNKRLPKINSLSGGSTENIYEDSCSCSNDNDSDCISNTSNDWVNKSDSIDIEQEEFENEAFTSDIEKRSLIVRHMRRLIRQDTSGNFAPPDFSLQC